MTKGQEQEKQHRLRLIRKVLMQQIGASSSAPVDEELVMWKHVEGAR